ncbi:hypothetical protein SARC_07133 [Sphaeroforma arctica JP610]|uniref:Protein ARV n=1 Tax=Sphaeroforma arctica JP610 TaxID=667725 RepID=A0A0L0FVC5_9EUKA|nr:hypothetical protein SARC_07133 [Sphaeroforma arctica JP610]KNC80511.1 hypothetical protein SARC_07133 [Sphaeroforma arctica JP610]|eukprot:XP_014154413.1 hypothetical protein SARC_07133 [Sphaeroforma arctica JP610]
MGGSSSNGPEAKIPDLSTSVSSVTSRISDMLDVNAHGEEPKREHTNPLGYVCIECGAPVKSIYREYSRGNIRLTRCAACGRIADKYCELEAQLIITDMLLHKPMASAGSFGSTTSMLRPEFPGSRKATQLICEIYMSVRDKCAQAYSTPVFVVSRVSEVYLRMSVDYGKEADKWMWKLMLLILLCDAYLRCNVVFGQEVQSDIHPAVLALLFFLALGVSTVAFATYSFALILLNVGRCSNWMIVSALALSSFPKLLITLQWVWIYKYSICITSIETYTAPCTYPCTNDLKLPPSVTTHAHMP